MVVHSPLSIPLECYLCSSLFCCYTSGVVLSNPPQGLLIVCSKDHYDSLIQGPPHASVSILRCTTPPPPTHTCKGGKQSMNELYDTHIRLLDANAMLRLLFDSLLRISRQHPCGHVVWIALLYLLFRSSPTLTPLQYGRQTKQQRVLHTHTNIGAGEALKWCEQREKALHGGWIV